MCLAVVDTYGFALSGLTDREKATREKSLQRTTQNGAAWRSFVRRGSCGGWRMNQLIRRGIPPNLRPEMWMRLSGAHALKAEVMGSYYKSLVKKMGRVPGEVLDLEMIRQFRMNLGVDGMDAVRRVLMAYEMHSNAEAANGMAPVVAFLLVVMGKDREEDVFWMFISLLENKLFDHASYKFAFWCRAQEGILYELLKKKNPLLAEDIENFASLHKICDKWFSSLFVMTFPSETVARIWDCLWWEGPKVLHRVALATLNRNQNTIVSMAHSVNLPKILTYKLRRTFDGNELMIAAFHSVGSMPSAMLASIRHQTEKELKGEPMMAKKRNGSEDPISSPANKGISVLKRMFLVLRRIP